MGHQHKENLSPEEKRRKMQVKPKGSHKEKAGENKGRTVEAGYLQGLKSNPGPKVQKGDRIRSPMEFDREEGQEREQF